MQEIVRVIREMEEKSDFECNKVRADHLMEKEKYLSSIYEYKRLLESNEAGEQRKELIGNIWHNLGTAYARMFLFQEAMHCYEKAYTLNQSSESMEAIKLAGQCLNNEIIVEETDFDEKLEVIATMNGNGQKRNYKKAVSEIIFNWKEEYRRICRI